ncbi:MAG TPA: hypothetical protein VFA37_06075 [Gaiellaceae bacterium]|nr:hypothetical protein [Gaiellaceae bacterium]
MAAVRLTWRRFSIPQWMLLASLGAYGATFALLATYGRPGLGISGGFYLAVILMAAATSPVFGALAGLGAIVLFELAIHNVDGLAWRDFDNATALTHLTGFVAAGVLTGFLAFRFRRMLAQSLYVLEDLIELAHDGRPTVGIAVPDRTD